MYDPLAGEEILIIETQRNMLRKKVLTKNPQRRQASYVKMGGSCIKVVT
jgi:hypothetical protein